MIPVNSIPKSLDLVHPGWGGTYRCLNSPGDEELSWYFKGDRQANYPHVSVVKKASQYRGDVVAKGGTRVEGNSFSTTGVGLDGSVNAIKIWILKKFHISYPLGGTNLHVFYKVTGVDSVQYVGSNLQFIPSYKKNEASTILDRDANALDAFAWAFLRAALAGWAKPPSTLDVGPQGRDADSYMTSGL